MTGKKLLQYGIVVLTMLLSFTLSAADSASAKLNTFVNKVVTYKANFQQTVLDPQGNVMEKAQGVFVLERPGKFRWDYQEPFPQHIVADGQRIWFYDVDLEQVTVKSQQEALTDTPATLLSGNSLPTDKYIVTDVPSEDGMLWVELTPKNVDSSFQTIALAFDQYGLRTMIMKDSFDQRTRLVFSQAQENPVLTKDTFVFTPAPGVDVVGDTGL
ncbi:MAG: outer membrane lipoprotein chaperone LolA [Pseudomonadota bacterium]|nr:outer membrane lipoprotein chaperone LolA [Pseudomonadota bacterium]MDO7667115.1 outer membrane lipoprotein chaperone LolA [Pseudomonadota bacterium]MDO7710779.1 outer membrane lipoprotein chaperone LolA [Pseudomonadota bacterium]